MLPLETLLSLLTLLPLVSPSRSPRPDDDTSLPPQNFTHGSTKVVLPSKSYNYVTGETATLECIIHNLGRKQVIWRRTPDAEPLTVGLKTFYNNDRIVVQHTPQTHNWDLVIRGLTLDDSGMYECQVSSRSLYLREHVTLVVREAPTPPPPSQPVITIEGQRHVDEGQDISLTCNAVGLDHIPEHLDWFFEGNRLSSDENRMEIKVKMSISEQEISSTLKILGATQKNSGVYACRASDYAIVSDHVLVLNTDTKNSKRGTESGRSYESQGQDQTYDSGRSQSGYTGGAGSSCRVSAVFHRHLLVAIATVLGVASYWLFPS